MEALRQHVVQPALGPEDFGVGAERRVQEQPGEIESDVYATREDKAVERVAHGGRNAFTEVSDGREDAEAFTDAGLEVGEFSDLVFEGGG